MLVVLILLLFTTLYLILLVLIATGLFKDPILHQFERYAEQDDSIYLLPSLLLGMGLFAIFGGIVFSETVAPRYPPFLLGTLLLIAAYYAHGRRAFMKAHAQIFMSFPHWYVELCERTTREERRRIAYMWLCLPRRMRMHLNGSDPHFLIWADQVILATVTQTVEDQEAKVEGSRYLPDLHGRYG